VNAGLPYSASSSNVTNMFLRHEISPSAPFLALSNIDQLNIYNDNVVVTLIGK